MSNPWDPTLNTVILAVGLLIQLGTFIYYAGRFSNRIDALESRMTDSETDIKRWKEEAAKLTAIDTKLDLLGQELSRVRDRLDKAVETVAFRRLNER